MNKKKKSFALLCAAAMCCAAMAACSSASYAAEGDASSAAGVPSAEATAASAQTPPSSSSASSSAQADMEYGAAANIISDDGTYSVLDFDSSNDDENALRVEGATATLDDVTVSKMSGESTNAANSAAYGRNAAFLALNGANVTMNNSAVSAYPADANAVVAYGDGTGITLVDVTVMTDGNDSATLLANGGAVLYATNVNASTEGDASMGIRTGGEGATVVADGGSYTTNSLNSPAVYSTGDVSVRGAVLTAYLSQALVVEGDGMLVLEECAVSGSMGETGAGKMPGAVQMFSTVEDGRDGGSGQLSITGGSLETANGDLFYVTNTAAGIVLSGVEMANTGSGGLIRVEGGVDSTAEGTVGENGGNLAFTADGQTLTGDVTVDSISTLALTLKNGSTFEGAVNVVENTAGSAVPNNATVTVDEGCTWTLTGNCTLSYFANNGTVNYNGYTITLDNGEVLG